MNEYGFGTVLAQPWFSQRDFYAEAAPYVIENALRTSRTANRLV